MRALLSSSLRPQPSSSSRLSLAAITHIQRRWTGINPYHDEQDKPIKSCFELLGFPVGYEDNPSSMRAITKDELKRRFIHKVRQLTTDEDEERNFYIEVGLKPPPQLDQKPRIQPTGVTTQRKQENNAKLREIVRAYNAVADSISQTLYANRLESNNETTQGFIDAGSMFDRYDPHHTEFQFADTTTRSFGDYRQIFVKRANVWENTSKDRTGVTPLRGNSVSFLLRLSFDEALYGCSKELEFEKKTSCVGCSGTGHARTTTKRCPQCHGNGRVELPSGNYLVKQDCSYCLGKGNVPPPPCVRCSGTGQTPMTEKALVSIEPGAENMSEWRLKGRGDSGFKGGPSGDLVVTVLVQDHRLFNRVGRDLHTVVAAPLSVGLLGGVVDVPTLRGKKQLRIPPHTATGTLFTIQGEGVPAKRHGETAGNLRVHVIIAIPHAEVLTNKQKIIIRKLSREMQSPMALEEEDSAVDADDDDDTPAANSRRGYGPRASVGETSEEPDASSSANEAGKPLQEESQKRYGQAYGSAEVIRFEGIPEDALLDEEAFEQLASLKRSYKSWLPEREVPKALPQEH